MALQRISRRRWWTAALLFVLVLTTMIYGQNPVGETGTRTTEALAAFRGQQVYSRACVACHGKAGDGNGPAAKYLDPRPRDFTAGTYKFRSTLSGELPTDEDLYRTIAVGIPRTMMPAWEDLLSEQERRDLVAYIKTFSKKFEKFGPGKPILIGKAPAVTQQTLAEGKSLYMIMECWACHGVRGKGDGKSANTLKDDWGRKIKPFNFTVGNYKGGKDIRSVYKTFNTGLNGTPMPSFADAFLFGGDSIGELSNLLEAYTTNEITALQTYLAAQPTEAEIGNMSAAELQKLADRRSWSLVHFVTSLSKKPGLFYRLFVEDTEVTQ